MYDDGKDKTIDDLLYLVNKANETEGTVDRLTVLRKANILLSAIIERTNLEVKDHVLR